ncbi:MAG: peptidoglycan-binding protein [Cyanomargarita calcarea GSE-NOS-MK-12-04C]|jgi:peptidoglycan hydrolase-like protein with peptidoglycan-binding domain|uniref:Peptidoglycan-binding protein n=1 Tax=Cyanomargarita calcarea GSE-NOS-MK-12-04C TaxID=2839659 RepID=A0A951UUR9_9CYAN|nr:peptidoglycan-binding protein [Cyanomargarita calcarea GSE-NOS-MK-12-04C]
MKTIGYLHLSSVCEASESIEVVPFRVNFKFFTDLDKKKLSFGAAMGFLSVALTMGVMSATGQALAVQSGATGAEVTNIQRCLRSLGYFNGPVTGKFGQLTQNAVIKFQRANRIPAVGQVGPATQRALQSQCQTRTPGGNASTEIRQGVRSAAVTRLQRDLQSLGFYRGSITGFFGIETQQAVIQFQQRNGIQADGVVGSRTREAIRIALNPNLSPDGFGGDRLPNVLNVGDVGPQVRELQNDLRLLRYFTVNPTGRFGPTTRDAVARFQRDYGIVSNGIADARTLEAVRRAVEGSNQGGCSASRGEICLGENSPRVVALQQRLQELRLFLANPTGLYGPATRDAVTQFQRFSGLNPTGFVDFPTWQALGFGSGIPNNPTPPTSQAENRYIVVVPIQNDDTLLNVRQFVPEAVAAQSRRGDYVNAGAFRDRLDAEKLTKILRDRGLDARVEVF